jgi:hypothetical protein
LAVTVLLLPLVRAVHPGGGDAIGVLLHPHVPVPTVLARLVFIPVLALNGGIGLVRPALGSDPVTKPVKVLAWVAAGLGVLVCIRDAAAGQASIALSALLGVLLVAAALYAWYGRVRLVRWVHAGIGGVLALLGAVELGSVRSGLAAVCDAGYAVAVAVLVGASVHALVAATAAGSPPVSRSGKGRAAELDPAPDPAVVTDRLTAAALVAGVLATAAGVLQLALTGPGTWVDARGGYLLAALAQAVLPLLATATWVAVRRVRRPALLTGTAAAVAVVALGAAAALATLPPPPQSPVPGHPLLRPVHLGARQLAVLITPLRPGPNLVHLTGQGSGPLPSATVRAGNSSAPLVSRPGTAGGWAVLDIPLSSRTLTVTAGPDHADVPIDVGTTPADPALRAALTGPDGPECASATLGALAAGAPATPRCPATGLDPSDAQALRAAVTFLAGHGVTTLDLAVDGSARSVAAEQVVRAEAAASHLGVAASPGPNDTLILLTGWDRAPGELHALTARVTGGATGGAVLAPWLLTAPVLGQAGAEMIPLTFDPTRPPARKYTGALAAAVPGEPAAPSGYRAWAHTLGNPIDGPVAFYGASLDQADQQSNDPDNATQVGGPSLEDWYPTGNIVALHSQSGP